MNLADAIAVFDKSADRTRPNAQTEAWAVIRAELMRVMDAPVAMTDGYNVWTVDDMPDLPDMRKGKRVRLVEEPTNGD